MGGQYFWKTQDAGLAFYNNNLSTRITNDAAYPKLNDDIQNHRCTCEEALDLASLTTDWARETLREAAVPSPPPYFRLMYLDDMNLGHNKKKLAKQKVFKRS